MKKLLALFVVAFCFVGGLLAETIDLSTIRADRTIYSGTTLTGTLSGDHKLTIEPDATVTLSGASITDDPLVPRTSEVHGLTCSGNARIILKGENVVNGLGVASAGIYVPAYSTLTIEGDGSLSASGQVGGAGIGSTYYGASGDIVIKGGTITARGGANSAGIGSSDRRACGDITIEGGTVTATGGSNAAGIGSGGRSSCTIIRIKGGTVVANGGENGAGIGAGAGLGDDQSSCATIFIEGGTVTATGGTGAAGIGCGNELSSTQSISIERGTVVANGGVGAAGIGSGSSSTSDCWIEVHSAVTRVTATRGGTNRDPIHTVAENGIVIYRRLVQTTSAGGNTLTITSPYPPSEWNGNLNQLMDHVTVTNGMTLTGRMQDKYKVTIAAGATVTLSGVTIAENNEEEMSTEFSWAGLTCEGDATLILEGNNRVCGFHGDYPGIYVPYQSTLTIKGAGYLEAHCTQNDDGCAPGIGGECSGAKAPCGNIVLESGTIIARGGTNPNPYGSRHGPGIGPGYNSDGGNITVKAGVTRVKAESGGQSANPIGGEIAWHGKVIVAPGLTDTENGTTRIIRPDTSLIPPADTTWDGNLATLDHNVTAADGTVIHGTLNVAYKVSIAPGASVTLSNASIQVVADDADHLWAGFSCLGDATITLAGNNNTIKSCHFNYPGIYVPPVATLIIQGDGPLNASGGYTGAGIGGGFNLPCGNIIIQGGTITATGGGLAAGIGSSRGSGVGNSIDCGTIEIRGGNVTASGGDNAAGIGTGYLGVQDGRINIYGGTVTATGGKDAAGIGSGRGYVEGGKMASCGDIDIAPLVSEVYVTATCGAKEMDYLTTGAQEPQPIGAGGGSTCGNVTSATGLSDGTENVTAGKIKRIIKSWDGDLATLTGDATARDGTVIHGELAGNYKVSIAAGATVTLSNASINASGNLSGAWAGLTCLAGDNLETTIILEGVNNIRSVGADYPGIQVEESTRFRGLNIKGDGELVASASINGKGAGIGGAVGQDNGAITIESGTITAIGGAGAAGIGSATNQVSHGGIIITGGSVTASGGVGAAGIGCGAGEEAGFAGVTIHGGTVAATGGAGAAGIGKGAQAREGVCGGIEVRPYYEGAFRVVATAGAGGVAAIDRSGDGLGVDVDESLFDRTEGSTRTIWRWDGNLAEVCRDTTVTDGTTLYGTLAGNYKISIEEGAAVTLSNANVNAGCSLSGTWAGLTCAGDATVILADGSVNTVYGFYDESTNYGDYPGIYVPVGSTLTIAGAGTLNAHGDGAGVRTCQAAGIGGGFEIPCGNIVIAGGTINAYGGSNSAGIGGGYHASCGTISITGGNVTAKNVQSAAGIGSGYNGSCGTITIGSGIVRVVAKSRRMEGQYGEPVGKCLYGASVTVNVDPALTKTEEDTEENYLFYKVWTYEPTASGSYAAWATDNGVTGAWDATDANGIYNVFRYVFNKPTGAFTDPVLLSITFNELGKAVVVTPEIVNTDGFTIKILASDNVDGTGSVARYDLVTSGATVINESTTGKRFFRLEVMVVGE